MRNVLLLAFALPLMAQEPAPTPTPTPAPAAAPTPAPEANQQAAPAAAPTPAPEAAPPPAAPGSNWLTGTLDAGYRFTTGVAGDFNTYRSVVNLGRGPKLFGANFTIQPAKNKWVDRIDVSANSWGGDPYNTARVDARKEGLYEFTFDYRNIAYFNFLPSFANPGTVNNALPFLDQYGFDITRRTSDFRLDLFPGHHIVPYVAFSRNGGRGGGTINYVLQSDEYTVPTNYSDYTDEYRAGVRFEYNHWHLTLEQGGYTSQNNQSLHSAGASDGNVLTPILGQQLFLTSGAEFYGVRGDGLFSRALFTANPVSWADISAQFLFSQPHMTANFGQSNVGNFIDLAIPSFFGSESSVIDALAKQPHPAGSASIELKPFGGRLRILESWMTDQLHNAGTALLTDQLLLTKQGATGGTPLTLTALDMERFVATYNQQETDLLFDITPMVTLRGGYRYVWGDALAPASITVQGSTGATTENGKLRRSVGIGGLSFRSKAKFRGTVDFEASPGDRSYFRTSLNDYQRATDDGPLHTRGRPRVHGAFHRTEQHQPGPGHKLQPARARQHAGRLLEPREVEGLRAERGLHAQHHTLQHLVSGAEHLHGGDLGLPRERAHSHPRGGPAVTALDVRSQDILRRLAVSIRGEPAGALLPAAGAGGLSARRAPAVLQRVALVLAGPAVLPIRGVPDTPVRDGDSLDHVERATKTLLATDKKQMSHPCFCSVRKSL